jgi:hypothetical protein
MINACLSKEKIGAPLLSFPFYQVCNFFRRNPAQADPLPLYCRPSLMAAKNRASKPALKEICGTGL